MSHNNGMKTRLVRSLNGMSIGFSGMKRLTRHDNGFIVGGAWWIAMMGITENPDKNKMEGVGRGKIY